MVCSHEIGVVNLVPSQSWVRVEGKPLLVKPDPVGRPIKMCPNLTVVTKPCTSTLRVRRGYSSFIAIDGQRLCLRSVTGATDGTGGIFTYKVNNPGQQLVGEVTP